MLTSIILLAGGSGSRFGSRTPKQFLVLGDKPLFQHSLELFLTLSNIVEIIVVIDEAYRHLVTTPVKFANPGKERQDSVYNGLCKVSSLSEFILIHDSARPLVTKEAVLKVMEDGYAYLAATLATPLKFSVKEALSNHFVNKTIDRSKLFEIQTPQVIAKELLKEGFEFAKKNNCSVTDDVSLVELLGKPVKLTLGEPTNIKVTTPDDLEYANYLYGRKKNL